MLKLKTLKFSSFVPAFVTLRSHSTPLNLRTGKFFSKEEDSTKFPEFASLIWEGKYLYQAFRVSIKTNGIII